MKIRPTSVQGLLRTGAEDRERRRRLEGRGPRRDHAADRPTPPATWLVDGKRDSSLTLTASCDRTGRSLSLEGVRGHVRSIRRVRHLYRGCVDPWSPRRQWTASAAARYPGNACDVASGSTHLAEHYTVVATDLRGYGDSGKPPSTADHEPYSMRAIGRDQLGVMRHLGYDQFSVAGHDRGARLLRQVNGSHRKRQAAAGPEGPIASLPPYVR